MEFKALLAFGGTVAAFLFGAWHISLSILVTVMIIDLITGIAKGAYTGKLRSAVGFNGMLRKGLIMLVIILANLLDLLVGNPTPVFRTMAVFFYIGNEALSIIENLGQMGVPIPKAIAKYLEQLSKEENFDDKKGSNDK